MCEFCKTIYGFPRGNNELPENDCIFQYADGTLCILIYNGTWINYHERRLADVKNCPYCGIKLCGY